MSNQKQTSFSGFDQYKQQEIGLTNDLRQLKAFSQKMNLDGNAESIEEVLKRLTENTFSIGIIGEFKRGKSTLINALMGKGVLPMDVLPTTATLNKVTYSMQPFVRIVYKDERVEEIDIDKLNDYVTKLTKESEEKAKTIKEATVYYPVNYCKNGVTIIDTPGLNDDEAMTEVTMSVLPQLDAALMVVMAQSPFSESERSFLESKVITSDLGRILFVVTGIDLLDEEDVDRVLQNITNRIQEHVMKKAENTFGADSKEFEDYRRKIGKVRVYGLSAKKALRAKLRGDDNMLAQSCFPTFEAALENFLTEDRGAVMLSAPVSRIKTASIEIAKAASLRENALAMQKEEFDKKYQEAMQEFERIRNEREKEFYKINEGSDRTYKELLPAINSFWATLEQAGCNAVDNFPLSAEDLSSANQEDTQERINKVVGSAIARAGQEASERIQETINQAMTDEAERLAVFEGRFYDITEKIQGLFVAESYNASGNEDKLGGAIAGIAAAAGGGFLGLGGFYEGYKQAGWKGALLGGGTAAASFFGSCMGINLLLGALAIPLAWPVALIATVGVGIFSTFVGKKAVRKWLPGGGGADVGKIEKARDAIKDVVKRELDRMRTEEDFSEKVRSQVEGAFNALKDKIRTETDRIMEDTQNQLTQLKVELAKDEATAMKEKQDMKDMLAEIDAICMRANEIDKQLAFVLTREA